MAKLFQIRSLSAPSSACATSNFTSSFTSAGTTVVQNLPLSNLQNTITVAEAATPPSSLAVSICAGSVLNAASLGTGGNAALLTINGNASVNISCSALTSPPSCMLDGGNAHALVIAVGGGVVSITGMELRDGNASVSGPRNGPSKLNNGGALRQKGGSVSLAGDLIDHNYAYNMRAQRHPLPSIARLLPHPRTPRFLISRTTVQSTILLAVWMSVASFWSPTLHTKRRALSRYYCVQSLTCLQGGAIHAKHANLSAVGAVFTNNSAHSVRPRRGYASARFLTHSPLQDGAGVSDYGSATDHLSLDIVNASFVQNVADDVRQSAAAAASAFRAEGAGGGAGALAAACCSLPMPAVRLLRSDLPGTAHRSEAQSALPTSPSLPQTRSFKQIQPR